MSPTAEVPNLTTKAKWLRNFVAPIALQPPDEDNLAMTTNTNIHLARIELATFSVWG